MVSLVIEGGCCCGSCVGCCFPFTPGAPMPSLNWLISAPSCSQLDGASGVLNAQVPGADQNADGSCGKCACYPDVPPGTEPIVNGTFEANLGSPEEPDCFESPCSFLIELGLSCDEEENAIEGLPDCCSRLRLQFGTDGHLTGIGGVAGSTLPCVPTVTGQYVIIPPTSCACGEGTIDAIFDLSGVNLTCPAIAPPDCNDCCEPSPSCSLVGATLTISYP